MTITNSPENSDNFQVLNTEIRQTLTEVLPTLSPELQLEIISMFRQIHRINCLIDKQKKCWIIGRNRSKNRSVKCIFLLEEIKNILLISKSDKISVESIREFRIILEKEVNRMSYLLWGDILNFFTYIYNMKSTPFRIFLGLSVTTLIAIILLSFSAREIYGFDKVFCEKNIEQSTPQATKYPLNSEILSTNPNEKLVASAKHHVWYSLVYCAIAGLLGSVASILLRIIDFQEQKYDDPLVPFFIGLFKPLLGLIFGIFIFSLLSSNTFIKTDFLITASGKDSLSLITNTARQDLFLFSCAFLAGFSERFASDLIQKSESAVTGGKGGGKGG